MFKTCAKETSIRQLDDISGYFDKIQGNFNVISKKCRKGCRSCLGSCILAFWCSFLVWIFLIVFIGLRFRLFASHTVSRSEPFGYIYIYHVKTTLFPLKYEFSWFLQHEEMSKIKKFTQFLTFPLSQESNMEQKTHVLHERRIASLSCKPQDTEAERRCSASTIHEHIRVSGWFLTPIPRVLRASDLIPHWILHAD